MLLSYVCFHLSVIDVTNTYRRYMYVLFCVRLVTRAIVSREFNNKSSKTLCVCSTWNYCRSICFIVIWPLL